LEEKAHLILKSFDLMGYHAIGIGDDDLSLGKEFLIGFSKTSNVPFLSSNLIDQGSGKAPFQRYLLKEVNGLKIGIFSLLSPDTFIGASDPRKKGLTLRDPFETAQEMVRELGSQTDLIILLSHLSYQKDMELARKIPGIHLIIGSHTGVDLTTPPVINNTIILQNSSKGMYGRKFNLTFSNREATFYNIKTKQLYERNLAKFRKQLSSANASEAEKSQLKRAVEGIEQTLKQLQEKNPFEITSFPLGEAVKDHPDIKKMVDDYKSKFPEKSEPPIHDSHGIYRPKSP
jgi:2',3'-cyclic-nucleotide 2'-phosphodiesterase (5'-nucleotidase family)